MRKWLVSTLFCLSISFNLIGCSPSPAAMTPTAAPAAKSADNLPYIQRSPSPANWNRGVMNTIPTYNPDSDDSWQMDLRSYNLSKLDMSQSLKDLLYASFDDRTTWPAKEKMPQEYDWQKIMEWGKNPGLGVRALHTAGVTGRGVGIAIIDQALLVGHQEYKDQLKWYEEGEDITGGWMESSMHGAAVASIAVGKTVGVAPEADLYFWATSMCNNSGTFEGNDYACLAKMVRRVLEVNRQLPEGHKIRVISISVGWGPQSKGYKEITAAVNEVKDAGLLIVSSSVEEVHGFKFNGAGRDPLADPDSFSSYEPGIFWAKNFYAASEAEKKFFDGRLLVPMDSRTTASPTGVNEYVFYRDGGWSWSIPYIAGVYALAAQVKPDITPDEFWQTALKTGQTIELQHAGAKISFGPILDAKALIQELRK